MIATKKEEMKDFLPFKTAATNLREQFFPELGKAWMLIVQTEDLQPKYFSGQSSAYKESTATYRKTVTGEKNSILM